ncbi:hypothetical protein GPECTOR_45g142 [Gonium pectorale]|uniref:Uncharacterized protein n=1 Tax=Gonium pectorale TaxID=33097 RepID=A0A150G8U5_GONPE|nr:hypothetical protein GPECTOR_45g142 [Gonium pectorale]|eukprot:KXZ46272.1 hypothetical protein GPECTOR_45g142 [Gonium pectorale]
MKATNSNLDTERKELLRMNDDLAKLAKKLEEDNFLLQKTYKIQSTNDASAAVLPSKLERLWLAGALDRMPRPLPDCSDEVKSRVRDLRRSVFGAAYERLIKGSQADSEALFGEMADMLYGSVRARLGYGAGDKQHQQLPAEGRSQLMMAMRAGVLAGTLARAIGGEGGGDGGFVRSKAADYYRRSGKHYYPVDAQKQRVERPFSATCKVPCLLLSLCPGYMHAGPQGATCYQEEKVAATQDPR